MGLRWLTLKPIIKFKPTTTGPRLGPLKGPWQGPLIGPSLGPLTGHTIPLTCLCCGPAHLHAQNLDHYRPMSRSNFKPITVPFSGPQPDAQRGPTLGPLTAISQGPSLCPIDVLVSAYLKAQAAAHEHFMPNIQPVSRPMY